MSGSIDIGFGGSGGGSSSSGVSTASYLQLGAGPYAPAGDIRGSSALSINAYASGSSARVAYWDPSTNLYFGGALASSVGFQTYGAGMTMYPGGLVITGTLSFSNMLYASTQTVQTTSPAAGGGGALPATPKGYWQVQLNGTNQLIPYY